MALRGLLAVAALLPSLAPALTPGVIPYQGRLRSSDGAAVSGVIDIGFALFADAEGGQPLWSEVQTLGLSDGYFAANLGSQTAFGASVWTGADRYLELIVGGAPLAPRLRIGSVPHAITASSVKGGAVEAASVSVGGASGARLAAQGSAPVNGTGLVTGTVGSTSLSGSGTAFLGEVAEGDILIIGTASYQVTAVQDNAALQVTPALAANIASAFRIQKPVCRFDSSGDAAGVFVNGQGSVGIGTRVISGPARSLEVGGTIHSHGSLRIDGPDLNLGRNDSRPIGNTPHQRALVHDLEDKLVVNYAGDFEGGVRVDSDVVVRGSVSADKFGKSCTTVVGDCFTGSLANLTGDCGEGLFMRGFRFRSCGQGGLQLEATCCR